MPPVSNLEIRQFELADAPELETMIRQARNDGELKNYDDSDINRLIEGLGDEPEKITLAIADGEFAGFLARTWDVLFVARKWRRRRVATRLVAHVREKHPDIGLSPERDNPGTKAFLHSIGFGFDHLMYQMKRPADLDTPTVDLPDGFSLRTYEHDDFDVYFPLWNRAFADHPTPLQVTEARVRAVHGRPDFDPARIALIYRGDDRNDLVGFITTRTLVEDNGETIGPIGAIGTDRSVRRLGLGRALLRWGIQTLRRAGAGPITLEVVTINERALPLYESEGFLPHQQWEFWTFKG